MSKPKIALLALGLAALVAFAVRSNVVYIQWLRG